MEAKATLPVNTKRKRNMSFMIKWVKQYAGRVGRSRTASTSLKMREDTWGAERKTGKALNNY